MLQIEVKSKIEPPTASIEIGDFLLDVSMFGVTHFCRLSAVMEARPSSVVLASSGCAPFVLDLGTRRIDSGGSTHGMGRVQPSTLRAFG